MALEVITLVLSIVAIILAGGTAVFSFLAYSQVVGLRNSTHQVYLGELPNKDNNPTGDALVKEFKEKMYPDEDDHI